MSWRSESPFTVGFRAYVGFWFHCSPNPYDGFRAQLFDLASDPGELRDLGADPAHAAVREAHAGMLFDWLRGLKRRTTISNAEIDLRGQAFRYGEPEGGRLVPIGLW